MIEVLLGQEKINYSSPRQPQCLLWVQREVWDEKWDVDRGDRGNAWLENWQRNGSRLPGGRLLWKEGLWAQMNKWLKSDQILSNKTDGPTVGWLFQGVDVRLRAMRAPGEASGLLGIRWKVVFWAHIHAACWWTLGDQTLSSVLFLPWKELCIPLSCRPRTKWGLHKIDSVGISSSRIQFLQPQCYLLTPWYVWSIDVIFDLYIDYL